MGILGCLQTCPCSGGISDVRACGLSMHADAGAGVIAAALVIVAIATAGVVGKQSTEAQLREVRHVRTCVDRAPCMHVHAQRMHVGAT